MGYELNLYVGEFSLDYLKTPALLCRPFGLIDLCKIGMSEISKLNNLRKEKPLTQLQAFLYAEDGNTKIFEDPIGEPLRVCTFTETLAALKTDASRSSYRRFSWALDLLRGIEKTEFVPALTSQQPEIRAYAKKHFELLKKLERDGVRSTAIREFPADKEKYIFDIRCVGVLLFGH